MSYADDLKYDARLTEHHIRRGVLSRDDMNSFLNGLPDDAEHGVETEARFVPAFAERGDDDSEEADAE